MSLRKPRILLKKVGAATTTVDLINLLFFSLSSICFLIPNSLFKEFDFGKRMPYHTTSIKEKEMAQHKSAIRQWRRSLRRNAINKRNKSMLRSQMKKLRESIKNKDREEAVKLLPLALSIIDKSVKKGTIHENSGRRYKSRLSQQVEMINPSPSK